MKLRKKVFPIIAMLLIVFMSGCKKDVITTGVPPKVTSTDPVNNTTGIVINSKISAMFSVAMDPSTITIENFTLKQGSTDVPGAVTYAGTKATFTPAANLATNTSYTATITTGAKDVSGKSIEKDYIWSLTTGEIADITRPTAISDPLNNVIDVALNKAVAFTFSEPMDPSTINATTFTLKQGDMSVPGAVTYTGTKAIFTPASNLVINKIYTGTITTGAKDLAGNALASNNSFSFTTVLVPDIALPMVNSIDPLNTVTGVAFNKVVALTFSEPMDPATINDQTFTLMQNGTVVPGTVVYSASDSTATFTPTDPLAAGLLYTATITTGAKDLAGNALAANTGWAFTTLPPVASTDPIDNVEGVALNKVVVLTFRVPMDPSTINETTLTLMQNGTLVPGTVVYSASDSTATFTPTNPLDPSLPYTFTLTTGAKDVAGNAQAANTVWTFTTGASVVNPLAVDLKTAGEFGILAATAVTSNAGASEIHDMDVGISPYARSYITGFPPAFVVNGAIYAADDLPATVPARLTQAKLDLVAAYDQAAGATSPTPVEVPAGLGGRTLIPGIYKSASSMKLENGNLTLDAKGDANAVWIFQIGSELIITGGASGTYGNVILANGAQAKNVFWQVGTSATIGDYTSFNGTVMAMTSITMGSGATAVGRMLARNGAVVLTSANTVAPNIITKP